MFALNANSCTIIDGHVSARSLCRRADIAPRALRPGTSCHSHVYILQRQSSQRRPWIKSARKSSQGSAIHCASTPTENSASSPASATLEDDAAFMRQALDLARKGLGKTHPNPAVGCVIVRDGKIVGEGYHPRAGEPHAEVFALRAAGKLAVGATAYVTLEPCNHFGRTPPCSRALVAAGIARVVVGAGDPNPLVGGAGIVTLRKAGIEVLPDVEAEACYEINREFMERMVAAAAAGAE